MQMKTTDHHQLTDAQPVPEQRPPRQPSPSFIAERGPLANLPPALLLSVVPYDMGYPFGQLSWLCPLPASCAPPAWSLAGRWEEQKRP